MALAFVARLLAGLFQTPAHRLRLAAGCCSGSCALMIAIIPATVILTWSLLGSLMTLAVCPAAFLAGHAVRYATGTQHRYPHSIVEDLRLTLVHGQHDARWSDLARPPSSD